MDTINKIRPAALEEAFELRPAQDITEISLYESRMNDNSAYPLNDNYFVTGTVPSEVEPREQAEAKQNKRIEVYQEINQ